MKNKNCTPQIIDCLHCDHRANNPICSSSDEVLKLIDQVKIVLNYKKDQVIFYEGTPPLGIYILTSGLVKLEANSAEGTSHTLRMVGPGGALGYRSLFANENYSASGIAVGDVQACFIPKTEILSLFTHFPKLALGLLELVSKDLRHAESKWVDQVDKDAEQRVAKALLFLQEKFLDQVWTRREIAQWAGTTPETVMRTLSQFEKDSLIDQKGRMIQILDFSQLQKIAGLI